MSKKELYFSYLKKVKTKKISSSILLCIKNTDKRKEIIENSLSILFDIENLQKIFNNPDIFFAEIEEDKKELGIKEIQKFIKKIQLKPFQYNFKAGIIENGHKMTIEAQNALLKTLEEPPQNTLILISTERKNFLLQTIVSRCKTFEFQDEEIFNQDTNEIKEILDLDIIKKFKYIENIFKEKNKKLLNSQIEDLLEKFLVYYRDLILKSKNDENIIKNIELVEFTQKAIRGNVSAKLALENLFFQI